MIARAWLSQSLVQISEKQHALPVAQWRRWTKNQINQNESATSPRQHRKKGAERLLSPTLTSLLPHHHVLCNQMPSFECRHHVLNRISMIHACGLVFGRSRSRGAQDGSERLSNSTETLLPYDSLWGSPRAWRSVKFASSSQGWWCLNDNTVVGDRKVVLLLFCAYAD